MKTPTINLRGPQQIPEVMTENLKGSAAASYVIFFGSRTSYVQELLCPVPTVCEIMASWALSRTVGVQDCGVLKGGGARGERIP